MSVLFKALQKAEKENEQRQAAAGGTGFDPGRLAGSGAIKMAGGRGINWRTAGLAAAFVLAVAIMAAFFLVGSPPPSQSPRIAAVTPPPAVTHTPPGTTEGIPATQPPAAETAATPAPAAPTAPAPTQVAEANAPEAATPAPAPTPHAQTAAPAATAAAAPAAPEAVKEVAAVPSPAPTAPKAAPKVAPKVAMAAPAPPPKQPMPDIPVNSPARMLNPPINVQRAEFELAGVGNAVQVREVSQKAQDNVNIAYNALVSGDYDTSLGFYERALKDEPHSVLALLGRAAALQKMRKLEAAQAAYNQVLKVDPDNREALSNLTVILAENAPAQAVTRLLEMEREYPTFSPIKAQLGLVYAKQGMMGPALESLRGAVALSPESLMYQYNLALVLDHMSLSAQAVTAYEKVLASLASGRSAPELSTTDIERRVRYLRTR